MTYRAVSILKEVDYILCEDTRTSGILLKHFEISKPLKSYHLHNEHQATDKVINDLKSGQNIAIITDAGTPGISDRHGSSPPCSFPAPAPCASMSDG
jgi:16S rRNA (cytidine1402-2'-O)-methyltransferase